MEMVLPSLSENCIHTVGRTVASAVDTPELAGLYTASNVKADQTYQAPTRTLSHPLLNTLKEGELYRGTFDWRSFNMHTPNAAHGHSLTVKGGDLTTVRETNQKWCGELNRRIANRQIPGAALLELATHEFNMALHLQQTALKNLGRLTFTAIPLQVSAMHTVQNRTGQQLSVRDYLNSGEYISASSQPISIKGGLGDLLIDSFDLKPGQYVYATSSLNIRINDMVNSRHFRTRDSMHRREEHQIDDLLCQDLLHHMIGGLDIYGDWLPQNPQRKDTVFRTIYNLLGDAYNFEADEVLPKRPITDHSYMLVLDEIPRLCERKGIARRVLQTFVSRLCEVAALTHAQKLTFSRIPEIGSSMMSRNVVYDGTVLDLDTVGDFTRDPASHIQQDYSEMTLSIAVMRRLVANNPMLDVSDLARRTYLENMLAFGASSKWVSKVEQAMASSANIMGLNKRL